jgi:hypothetical protein
MQIDQTRLVIDLLSDGSNECPSMGFPCRIFVIYPRALKADLALSNSLAKLDTQNTL